MCVYLVGVTTRAFLQMRSLGVKPFFRSVCSTTMLCSVLPKPWGEAVSGEGVSQSVVGQGDGPTQHTVRQAKRF